MSNVKIFNDSITLSLGGSHWGFETIDLDDNLKIYKKGLIEIP